VNSTDSAGTRLSTTTNDVQNYVCPSSTPPSVERDPAFSMPPVTIKTVNNTNPGCVTSFEEGEDFDTPLF